jgi:hypothetical protein
LRKTKRIEGERTQMEKRTISWRKLTIAVVLAVMLVNTAVAASAASGGEPGKPSDVPGNPSKTPPGQAKKNTPEPTTEPTSESTDTSTDVQSTSEPVTTQFPSVQSTDPTIVTETPTPDTADIVTEFNCRINQEPIGGGDTFTTDSRSVSSASGNTVLRCTGEISPDLVPDKAVIDTGFECITYLGSTTISRKVFTPSGKALLTCQINGQNRSE